MNSECPLFFPAWLSFSFPKVAVELGDRFFLGWFLIITFDRFHPFPHEEGPPEVNEIALGLIGVGGSGPFL
jgi:hypothetical protein